MILVNQISIPEEPISNAEVLEWAKGEEEKFGAEFLPNEDLIKNRNVTDKSDSESDDPPERISSRYLINLINV